MGDADGGSEGNQASNTEKGDGTSLVVERAASEEKCKEIQRSLTLPDNLSRVLVLGYQHVPLKF